MKIKHPNILTLNTILFTIPNTKHKCILAPWCSNHFCFNPPMAVRLIYANGCQIDDSKSYQNIPATQPPRTIVLLLATILPGSSHAALLPCFDLVLHFDMILLLGALVHHHSPVSLQLLGFFM